MNIESNASAVDWWTWAHFGIGAAMGALNFKPQTVVILTVGYEVVEQGIIAQKYFGNSPNVFSTVAGKMNPTQEFFGDESPANIAVDILSALAGYAFIKIITPSDARQIKWKKFKPSLAKPSLA